MVLRSCPLFLARSSQGLRMTYITPELESELLLFKALTPPIDTI